LSPIRPTYAAETESIVRSFPASHLLPARAERRGRIEALQKNSSNEIVAGSNGLLSTLSARLSRLRTNTTSSSGRSTPNNDMHRRQHVPSTNNSSGRATPRSFAPTSSAMTGGTATTTTTTYSPQTSRQSGTESKSETSLEPASDSGPTEPLDHQVDPFGLAVDMEEILAEDMGNGRSGSWVLATTQRRELQRMRGSGRSDEVEYWWWEIRWC
jgi:hypothetical protein